MLFRSEESEKKQSTRKGRKIDRKESLESESKSENESKSESKSESESDKSMEDESKKSESSMEEKSEESEEESEIKSKKKIKKGKANKKSKKKKPKEKKPKKAKKIAKGKAQRVLEPNNTLKLITKNPILEPDKSSGDFPDKDISILVNNRNLLFVSGHLRICASTRVINQLVSDSVRHQHSYVLKKDGPSWVL